MALAERNSQSLNISGTLSMTGGTIHQDAFNSPLTFDGTTTTQTVVINPSSDPATIDSFKSLSAPVTNLEFQVADGAASDDLVVSAALLVPSFTKTGDGRMLLDSLSNAGPIGVNAGTLALGTGAALTNTATPITIADGATLELRQVLNAKPIDATGDGVGGEGAIFQAPSTVGQLFGPITFSSIFGLSLGSGDASSTTVLSGNSPSGANTLLTKIGDGTLILDSGFTFTDSATDLVAGTLQVDGTMPGTVFLDGAGAVLKGTGMVGPVTSLAGGTLAPGDSPGIINTGSLSLNSATTLTEEIFGPTVGVDYDQTNVTGTVALGDADLDLNFAAFTPANGTTEEESTLFISGPGVLGNNTDPDNGSGNPDAGLTAVILTQPLNGTVTLNSDGSFTYIPTDPLFHGTDTFTYRAFDGTALRRPRYGHAVHQLGEPGPGRPMDDGYTTGEDTPLVVAAPGVLANDRDPDNARRPIRPRVPRRLPRRRPGSFGPSPPSAPTARSSSRRWRASTGSTASGTRSPTAWFSATWRPSRST